MPLHNENSEQTQNIINTLVLDYLLRLENQEDQEVQHPSHQHFLANIEHHYDEGHIPIRVRMCLQQFRKTMKELSESSDVNPEEYKRSVLNNIDVIRSILSEVPEDEFSLIFTVATFEKSAFICKITKWEDDLRNNLDDEEVREKAAGRLFDYVKILCNSLAPPGLVSIISDTLNNNDIRSIGSFMSEAISEIPLADEPTPPPREQEELRQTLNSLTPFSDVKRPTSRIDITENGSTIPDIPLPPGLNSTQTIICDSDEESQPSQLFLQRPSERRKPLFEESSEIVPPFDTSTTQSNGGGIITPTTNADDISNTFSDEQPEPPPRRKIRIGKVKVTKGELQEAVKAFAKKERRMDLSFTFKNKRAWDFIEKRVYGDDVSILGDSIIEEDTREPAFSPQRWKRRSDGKAARYWTKDELKALWEGFQNFGHEWETIYLTYKDRFHMTRHAGSLYKKFKRTLQPLIVDDEIDFDQIMDE